MAVWVFGVEPLPQTMEAAARLRRVTGLLLACEGDDPAVARLIADLDRAEAALSARVSQSATPRVGAAAGSDGRVYVDHARDVGAYNPCFPEYDIVVNGDRAAGMVAFPVAYEGPPGIVHGGVLALFLDSAAQQHNCDVGVAGKTTTLSLRYRRPAPLLTPLSFTIVREADDRRIRSTCEVRLDDRVLCEADIDAIAGDRAALPEVSPRRTSQP